MIYNTLNATMVKYEMVPGISANGQVTMTTQRVNVTKTENGDTKNVTLLSDKFNTLDIDPAVMTSFGYNDTKDEYTYHFGGWRLLQERAGLHRSLRTEGPGRGQGE